MTSIKDIPAEEYVLSGNGSCAGCPSTLALRIASKALGPNAMMVLTPSCTVASMGMTPRTAFNYPSFNTTFASAAAAASGLSGALESLAAKGKISSELPTVFNWVGDGGTYDIGLQAISAAAERKENMIHFCYNNEVYSNTGVQRSGATPEFAVTSTTPSGKKEDKKNMPAIMLSHRIPYIATASLAYPADFYDKVVKAKNIPGFKYIEILAPCYPGWKFESQDMIKLCRLAVTSGAQLLWEAENGLITKFSAPSENIVSGRAKPKGLDEYLELQGRFSHILKSETKDEHIKKIKAQIEAEIEYLLRFKA